MVFLGIGLIQWSKQPDLFKREIIKLRSIGDSSLPAILIRPRLTQERPMLVYVHEPKGSPIDDGTVLLKVADVGFTAVGASINSAEPLKFQQIFEELNDVLQKKMSGQRNGYVWLSRQTNVEQLIQFALRHPEQQPNLIVYMPEENERVDAPDLTINKSDKKSFAVMLIKKTKRYSSYQESLRNTLQNSHIDVHLLTFANLEAATDAVLFQAMAEKARKLLPSKSIISGPLARTETKLPAGVLGFAGLSFLSWFVLWCWNETRTPERKERLLKVTPALAGVLGVVVGAIITWKVMETPIRPADQQTISRFIKSWNLSTNDTRAVMNYIELAKYNSGLVNWNVNPPEYWNYVLSPILTKDAKPELKWRRILWTTLYPKVRKANSPAEAAAILVQELREEVEVSDGQSRGFDFDSVWQSRRTDRGGFECLYVAALRAIGVSARLSEDGIAEIYNNGEWNAAPPAIELVDQNDRSKS